MNYKKQKDSMKNIFWTGYCKVNRFVAINKIEQIISEYGYIVDFKQFSDISLSLNIEIEELNIDKLHLDLKSYIKLNDFDELNSSSNCERTIFLNITFTQATGNLKIELPAIS